MDLFADNDELFAKLKAGNPGYDVICPTNDNLERMIKANMVTPLDKAKLPNFSNMDPIFQDAAFDPGRKFSITYLWGTVGVGFRIVFLLHRRHDDAYEQVEDGEGCQHDEGQEKGPGKDQSANGRP